jgi:hypothetical protein
MKFSISSVADVVVVIVTLLWPVMNGVDGAISVDNVVICSNITVVQDYDYIVLAEICATGSYSSPSPAQEENGTVTYIGGYQNIYTIVQGLNPGDVRLGTEEEEVGIEIIVGRDDSNVCSGITVITDHGNVTHTCHSCTYCGNESYAYDCSNILYGRMVNSTLCESAIPGVDVFFPLTYEIFQENHNASVVEQYPPVPLPSATTPINDNNNTTPTPASTPPTTIVQTIVRFFIGIVQRVW